MSQSASQATAFYREVAETGRLWTVRDAAGFPAPLNSEGKRTQPFWSSRARVEQIIKSISAYHGFEPVELEWSAFLSRWIPGLAKDGILVGINWSGASVSGYDIAPEQVAKNVGYYQQQLT